MNITFDIPTKVFQRLKQKAESQDEPLEETILKIIVAHEDLEDPETKTEIHLKLSEKYLHECEELLVKEDYVQASEKAWGTASQMLKAVASKRGETLRSHDALNRYLDELSEEIGDPELDRLWGLATSLRKIEGFMKLNMLEVIYKEAEPFTTKVKHMDFSKARRDLKHDPKVPWKKESQKLLTG